MFLLFFFLSGKIKELIELLTGVTTFLPRFH